MKVLRELSNVMSNPWIIGGFVFVVVAALLIGAVIWRSQTNGSYRPPKKT